MIENKIEDKDESLLVHLEALRSCLLKCLASVALLFLPAWFISPKLLDLFVDFLTRGYSIKLNYFSPAEVFLVQIKTAAVLAVCIAFPYIAKQVWKFILPALYERERKFISRLVVISGLLFCVGVLFCLFVIIPFFIRFGLSFSTANLSPMFGFSNLVSLSMWMCVIFGLMFQFPLITFALISSSIVSYKTVCDKRPYIIVGILIIAAILTPPDVVSQLLLALPTYILFEAGLWFAKG